MSLFNRKKSEAQKEVEKKTLEALLPETMTTTYTEFISLERESYLEPIRAEIRDLKDREEKAIEIYHQTANNGENIELIQTALRKIRKTLSEKEDELRKADFKYSIDTEASIIAQRLDVLTYKNRLVDLYPLLGKRINSLLPLMSEMMQLSQKAEVMSNVYKLDGFVRSVAIPNTNDDMLKITKDNPAALRNKLNRRLNELKAIKEKERVINDTINA